MSPTDLRSIRTFPSLVKYLRDELDWPIETDDFDDLTFDYRPEELGIDPKTAASIEEIKQLRPLVANQPWGIFFIKFEPKKLPVVVLRRILRTLVIKKRASASQSHQATWNLHDLLFISSYGESDHRDITFAHFTESAEMGDLPALRVLGWDDEDTVLHLEHAHKVLREKLRWPGDPHQVDEWGEQWSSAFTLRHMEVITTSKDLAIQLARLSTAIRKRVSKVLSIETESGPLRRLMKAFKQVLIHDLYEEAFADMYAQTITYGLLSARVSRPAGLVADNIADMVPITNPFLKELLSTFLTVGGHKGKVDFDELGINEVVQALRNANMEAVLRDFGDKNPQEDPVIHFYELFLKEYNPKLRMQRGVFYTPRPVVSFIVRSVDEIIRKEFGLEDGLADTTTWGKMVSRFPEMKLPQGASPEEPFVQILDPALGTGTFLVEVIDIIHKTMTNKWEKAGHPNNHRHQLWNDYVPKHLLPRLYGFELLMAPYAIAHMKIGLKLGETGYRFTSDERAHIYLTNSLDSPSDIQKDLPMVLPALAHEAEAVNNVKHHKCFTVVIGNPPYSIQSQNLTDTARVWVDAYRKVAGTPITERNALQFEKNIQDDYIKFIRFSQFAVDSASLGVVGLVTNHGFLDGATFRGMRWSLLESFPSFCVLDLHGNSNKREVAPNGLPDENVFDISQGVAVSLMAKRPFEGNSLEVKHADLWGLRSAGTSGGKYRWLLSHSVLNTPWQSLSPTKPLFLLKPYGGELQREYESFPSLPEMMPLYSMGIKSSRDELVLDFDPQPLQERIKRFRNAPVSDTEICKELGVPLKKGWNVAKARQELYALENLTECIKPFLYRPFDFRLIFYHKAVVFSAAYPVMRHLLSMRNLALVATRQTKDQWDVQCSCTLVGHKSLGAYDANSVFPLYLNETETGLDLGSNVSVNFSKDFLRQINATLAGSGPTRGLLTPEEIFYYAYAVFNSHGFRRRYAEFLKSDFPRLPLTSSLDLFHELSKLGDELVSLHLMESPKLEKHIMKFVGDRNPEVEKISYFDETVWIDKSQTTGLKGVPENVWNFHIGGYQVCKKWLKDRKGRRLTNDDIEHYQKIVVALNETIKLMGEIEKTIEKHGGWPGAFTTPKT